jgi:hypothetical protein
VTNGMMGTIFATGLQTQCKEVEKHVKQMLSLQSSSIFSLSSFSSATSREQKKVPSIQAVNLNVVGLSRGGIAAIQLAQTLHYICADRLHINLLLFDPVPGNLITSSKFLDPFGVNTANNALNLTYCHNLCDVLALYPYQPLPDMTFHAPVLPQYPPQCKVEEDVTLGCHQGALFCSSKSIESRLSYFRIHEWLEKHDTKLHKKHDDGPDFTATSLGDTLSTSPLECKQLMDEVMLHAEGTVTVTRHTHSRPPGAVIIRHADGFSADSPGPSSVTTRHCTRRFLNKFHQQLSARLRAVHGGDKDEDTNCKTADDAKSNTREVNNNNENVTASESDGDEKVGSFLLEICRPTSIQAHSAPLVSCFL